MANVQVISSSVIQAASHKDNQSHLQRIDLTPWDLRFLTIYYIQKGLLFHKPNPESQLQTQTTLIQHLKASLSRTLEFFYPLAGRLRVTKKEDKTTLFIDCNNEGAQFVHAAADGVSIADILESQYIPSFVHSFFLTNGVKNVESVREKPLLAVQVTELVDGIFIGCSLNHAAADGTSFWHFINSWAEISRGFNQLSKPPLHQPWLPDDFKSPVWIPISYEELISHKYNIGQLKERVFHFSRDNIAALKTKANAEVGTSVTKISSLQALVAFIWQSVTRSRNCPDPDEVCYYRFLVGTRSRLDQVPENYFGNAVHPAMVTLKVKDVLDNGLGFVAGNINRVIAEHSEEKMRDYLKSWAEKPQLSNMLPVNFLVTSCSPRFDVYGNDFGWGRPAAVRSGSGNKTDGMITVYEGAEEGSLDIEACLCPNTLEAMENDKTFMDAVTIQ